MPIIPQVFDPLTGETYYDEPPFRNSIDDSPWEQMLRQQQEEQMAKAQEERDIATRLKEIKNEINALGCRLKELQEELQEELKNTV